MRAHEALRLVLRALVGVAEALAHVEVVLAERALVVPATYVVDTYAKRRNPFARPASSSTRSVPVHVDRARLLERQVERHRGRGVDHVGHGRGQRVRLRGPRPSPGAVRSAGTA